MEAKDHKRHRQCSCPAASSCSTTGLGMKGNAKAALPRALLAAPLCAGQLLCCTPFPGQLCHLHSCMLACCQIAPLLLASCATCIPVCRPAAMLHPCVLVSYGALQMGTHRPPPNYVHIAQQPWALPFRQTGSAGHPYNCTM